MKTQIVNLLVFALIGSTLLTACKETNREKIKKPYLTKIAFGSCAQQNKSLPIFDTIVTHQPDLFVFLGDNIYGDTKDMHVLKQKYMQLSSKSSYKNLKANTEIFATWDDHDYGWNDAGKAYEKKQESKEIFLDFFEEPKDSPRRKHKGIYHAVKKDYGGKILQLILLDVRTFRDGLVPYQNEFDSDYRYDFYHKEYAPHTTPDSTFLGKEQWQWLERQLTEPADVRIIASGSQFGIEWNSYESWANFPHERKRMLDLIKSTRANGVLFITGDVHYSEISKLPTSFYPIYDVTSSGLSSTWKFATPNKNRIEGPIMENHFGLISIDWEQNPVNIKMETWDINNNQRIEYSIGLNEISFPLSNK